MTLTSLVTMARHVSMLPSMVVVMVTVVTVVSVVTVVMVVMTRPAVILKFLHCYNTLHWGHGDHWGHGGHRIVHRCSVGLDRLVDRRCHLSDWCYLDINPMAMVVVVMVSCSNREGEFHLMTICDHSNKIK